MYAVYFLHGMLEIMKALWELGKPVSAAELNNYMQKGWRVQTLITHLARMVEKGVVILEHKEAVRGARYFYTPAVEKQSYVDWTTRMFVETIHGGSIASLQHSLKATGLLPEE